MGTSGEDEPNPPVTAPKGLVSNPSLWLDLAAKAGMKMPAGPASSQKQGKRGGQELWLVKNSCLSHGDNGDSAMTIARSLDFSRETKHFLIFKY